MTAEMPPMPDPRRLLARMQADVREFEARAERTNQALRRASVEVPGEYLTLRLLGSHLTGIEFHPAALRLTPAQLTATLDAALRQGAGQSNRNAQAVVAEAFGDEAAARGIAEAAPEGSGDPGDAPAAYSPAAEDAQRPMTATEQEDLLDDILNRMDTDDEPLDPAALKAEIGYVPSTVPPELLQADFDAQMDRIKASASRLPQLMERVTGTGTDGPCEVRVNAAGVILAARFGTGFEREGAEALGVRFTAAYDAARQDAQAQLREQLGGTLASNPFLDEL